jgi:3-oxoadipate enol-lactonase
MMPTTELRGFTIAHAVTGNSDLLPFVWGHGLGSSSALEDRYPIIDFATLAQDRPVVRYDARGHGESSVLDDARRGSWAELALDQIALIDHLGLESVAIGGASMGAATALHAALTLGKRVERMVLMIPPTAWEERAAQIQIYEQMASAVEVYGVEALIDASAQVPPPDPFTELEDWRDRRATTFRTTVPVRIASNFRGAAHADLPLPAEIVGIEAPTLILAWTGDASHPVATTTRLAELLSDVEVVFASTYDEVQSWTDVCRDFLRP